MRNMNEVVKINPKTSGFDLTKNNFLSEEKKEIKKTIQRGRPKKTELADKKIIIYLTEKELSFVLEKADGISTSPFLKKIVLDSLSK